MINKRKVKKYCCEDISLIENYDKAIADKTLTWHCHHRLEIQGVFTNSSELLKKCNMYYSVPASLLIFLTNSEHIKLHANNLSDTTHIKMMIANTGSNNPNYGKHPSQETLAKMSVSHSGIKHHFFGKHLSKETRDKISASCKGRVSPNKGKHLSKDTKHKLSASLSNLKWFNNGIKNVRARECPEGFVRGRIRL